MSLWRRRRYYCTNIAGSCCHALGDFPFSNAGRCGSCDHELVEGDPLDLRFKWLRNGLAIALIAAGIGWTVRVVWFPAPLEHVTFATAETKTDDRAGRLRLEVLRSTDIDRRVDVQFASTDGTAKAGDDYDAIQGTLTFERGERSKVIELSVLPDPTLEKTPRSFSLVLTNVRGSPEHSIRIVARADSRDRLAQTEQAVLTTSRIAADIAGFMAKRRVLMDLLALGKLSLNQIKEYKQQLIDAQDNLSRAREAYAESMRTLSTHEAVLVMRTMDRLAADLKKKNFAQQSRALGVMKAQFTELVNEQGMELDRWVRELENIVPRAADAPDISA
jgi:hypothetical protein